MRGSVVINASTRAQVRAPVPRRHVLPETGLAPDWTFPSLNKCMHVLYGRFLFSGYTLSRHPPEHETVSAPGLFSFRGIAPLVASVTFPFCHAVSKIHQHATTSVSKSVTIPSSIEYANRTGLTLSDQTRVKKQRAAKCSYKDRQGKGCTLVRSPRKVEGGLFPQVEDGVPLQSSR